MTGVHRSMQVSAIKHLAKHCSTSGITSVSWGNSVTNMLIYSSASNTKRAPHMASPYMLISRPNCAFNRSIWIERYCRQWGGVQIAITGDDAALTTSTWKAAQTCLGIKMVDCHCLDPITKEPCFAKTTTDEFDVETEAYSGVQPENHCFPSAIVSAPESRELVNKHFRHFFEFFESVKTTGHQEFLGDLSVNISCLGQHALCTFGYLRYRFKGVLGVWCVW